MSPHCSYSAFTSIKVLFGRGTKDWWLRCTVLVLSSVFTGGCTVGQLSNVNEVPTTASDSTTSCQRFENTLPICQFSNPEDIAVLPDHKTLLVSEHGGIDGARPGALVYYDIASRQTRTAFKGGDATLPTEYWGSRECTEPPGNAFSPHGIDLIQRSDGRWQLLVVQHGGRESIEFFELKNSADGVQLVWRGCAIAPEHAQLNAVAAGMGEEFFTTKMLSTNASWADEGFDPAEPTGLVYRWNKLSGFQAVANSEGTMLNGIAASRDGKTIFVIYSGENLLKKIDVKTGTILASTSLRSGDNVKWSADGDTILAASFVGTEDNSVFARCLSSEMAVCPIAFAIIELDPNTLSKVTLFENARAPMGAGTVGIKIDSSLFIGSFSSNRLLQVNLAQ